MVVEIIIKRMMIMKHIAWFSAGVSSAVTCKLALQKQPDLEIYYININDQHPDSLRFLIDCERWFGKKINLMQHRLHKSVEECCNAVSFIKGPGGAPCTRLLKKRVRKEWEKENPGKHTYYWGMDVKERNRADRIRETMPEYNHSFPLIEQGLIKEDSHAMLLKAGIRRPAMYEMGYQNNNCIGCVKGGYSYFNRIRETHPQVFAARAAMERRIGAHILKDCYLDELDPERGRGLKPIVEDCGIMCEIVSNEL